MSLATPLPVAVVRPKKSTSAHAIRAVFLLGMPFFNGYLLMLIIPAVIHWRPGYWQATLLYLGIGLWRHTDEYLQWTHEDKGGKR